MHDQSESWHARHGGSSGTAIPPLLEEVDYAAKSGRPFATSKRLAVAAIRYQSGKPIDSRSTKGGWYDEDVSPHQSRGNSVIPDGDEPSTKAGPGPHDIPKVGVKQAKSTKRPAQTIPRKRKDQQRSDGGEQSKAATEVKLHPSNTSRSASADDKGEGSSGGSSSDSSVQFVKPRPAKKQKTLEKISRPHRPDLASGSVRFCCLRYAFHTY
jgi:hypothetical protein